jgi:hypothetical protein
MLALHQLVGPVTDWWDAYVKAHEETVSVFSTPAIIPWPIPSQSIGWCDTPSVTIVAKMSLQYSHHVSTLVNKYKP